MTNPKNILTDEQLRQLDEAGYAVIPKEPTQGVLVSMAMREDHGFLSPQRTITFDNDHAVSLGLDDRARDVRLTTMKQIYEEVVGTGFYSPDKEDWYVSGFERVQQENKT